VGEVLWKPHGSNTKYCVKPTGKPVTLQLFVVLNHTEDQPTRRSITGFIQMVNIAMISWHSKNQGFLEGAAFGSSFVATKSPMEAFRALR
jgi:hypothetical protein